MNEITVAYTKYDDNVKMLKNQSFFSDNSDSFLVSDHPINDIFMACLVTDSENSHLRSKFWEWLSEQNSDWAYGEVDTMNNDVENFDDEDEWSEAWSKIIEKIEARYGRNMSAGYSAYDEDENELPIDNLDVVPVVGEIQFVRKPNGWVEHEWRSRHLTSPTWLDIVGVADDMIKTTGDEQHVFLEGINKVGEENGVELYELCMGS